MKTISAIIILILIWTFPVSGERINAYVAARLGDIHLKTEERFSEFHGRMSRSAGASRRRSVSEIRELRDGDRLLAYIIDLEPTGCVVVSPDTELYPVIAYSAEGRFSMEDNEENVFLHLVKWDMQNRLDALSQTPRSLRADNQAAWESYLAEDGATMQAVTDSAVWGPWLTTTWSQGRPYRDPMYIQPDYDYGDYNRYCPTAHSSEWRCVTGCGPLAMAQIVNYWKYPSSLSFGQDDSYTSSRSYDAEGQQHTLTVNIDADHSDYNFPDFSELNSKLSYIRYYDGDLYFWDSGIWDYRSPVDEDPDLEAAAKQEVKEDIAALCFACGIAFQADYSPEGTSAGISYYPNGITDFHPLLDKFGYSSAVTADIGWPQFYPSLQANMKNAQPAILIVESPTSGHYIVADGYRDEWQGGLEGYYHLNFGWGSANPDSVGDSWYHLPEGMPNSYNVVRLGVLDIYPPQQPQEQQQEIHLYPGWNFVSICLDIEDTNILSVLDQIKNSCVSVWSYDAATSDWEKYVFGAPDFLSDLDTIEPKKGYWIDMAAEAVLIVSGQPIVDTDIQLFTGWNHVGYCLTSSRSREEALSTIDGSYTAIWTYDNETDTWLRYAVSNPPFLNTLTQLEPGRAYWIEVSEGCVWSVSP